MGRPRLLIIDDEPGIRILLTEVLRRRGYEVDVASTGAGGLAQFEREPYALVVTDHRMPGMRGSAVIDAILAKEPSAKVMLLTGSPDPETERVRQQGVPIVEKPFRLPELIAAVEKLITLSRNGQRP